MAGSLADVVPDGNAVLEMEPEELAGVLLDLFISAQHDAEKRRERTPRLQSHELGLPHWVKGYPKDLQDDISFALMEAWLWLENNGFLAPVPGGTDRQYGESFLTRRAYEWSSSTRLVEFIRASQLNREALHPAITDKVWPNYIRGEFETAVFQSFRQVEIAVREAGGFDAANYGVDLMRDAFHPTNGPLTDKSALKAEREAMSALFAGAVGLFKNPSSHREVDYGDQAVAAEAIAFASLLLRLVDSRRPETLE